MKELTLLNPPGDVCQECAVKHKPEDPHDAQSFFINTSFPSNIKRKLLGQMQ